MDALLLIVRSLYLIIMDYCTLGMLTYLAFWLSYLNIKHFLGLYTQLHFFRQSSEKYVQCDCRVLRVLVTLN